jgi:hypothetical protein
VTKNLPSVDNARFGPTNYSLDNTFAFSFFRYYCFFHKLVFLFLLEQKGAVIQDLLSFFVKKNFVLIKKYWRCIVKKGQEFFVSALLQKKMRRIFFI